VVRGGRADAHEELRVARVATVVLGLVAVVLGIAFRGQNVAFMVSLAFAIAASGNFPALTLSMFWSRATTTGVVSAMVVGTTATLLLIYFSPTVQVDILNEQSAWFPLKNPALITVPLGFATGVIVSLLAPNRIEAAAFAAAERQASLGATG
jgi:cation/acetate symporter